MVSFGRGSRVSIVLRYLVAWGITIVMSCARREVVVTAFTPVTVIHVLACSQTNECRNLNSVWHLNFSLPTEQGYTPFFPVGICTDTGI
jgi:hypothetical protein